MRATQVAKTRQLRKELPRPTKAGKPARVAMRRGEFRQTAKPHSSRLLRAVAISVALASVAFALLYISPIFRVGKVIVVGAAAVAPDKVARAADVEGQNILAVDRNEVAKAVGQIPLVKTARVTRRLPNEVVINVDERHPWAIWKAQNGEFVVDEEGVVIGTPPSSQGLVTIVDTGNRPAKVGDRVESGAVDLAYRLSQILPKEVAISPKRFEFSQDTGLTVYSDKGWRARFGDAEDTAYKVSALKAILATVSQRNTKVEIIDLRSKGRPYYR